MPEVLSIDQFVERQLQSGKYQSYEAMVEAGLRLLQEREQELDAVTDSLRPAVEDFLRGDRGEEMDIEAFLAEENKLLSSRST
ncbi:MAG: type II toxin-antitoxin system ParD family antitoxin [Deltaproteobacteria bacterium]|nr:type II toxin-antitoxin system ParD family antitoxin [Deltaproteobacteria bacterium]